MAGLISSKFVRLGKSITNQKDVTSITPAGDMGLILLNASVNYTPASNQSSSIWLYMNSVSGTNTGYNTTGVSVVKIANLKHDFGAETVDCSLSGRSDSDAITIIPGAFNTFSYIDIPL